MDSVLVFNASWERRIPRLEGVLRFCCTAIIFSLQKINDFRLTGVNRSLIPCRDVQVIARTGIRLWIQTAIQTNIPSRFLMACEKAAGL